MSPSPDGTLRSAELDVALRPEGTLLRVVDPASGDVVPTLEEAMEQGRAAAAELERLRAELDSLRRGSRGK